MKKVRTCTFGIEDASRKAGVLPAAFRFGGAGGGEDQILDSDEGRQAGEAMNAKASGAVEVDMPDVASATMCVHKA